MNVETAALLDRLPRVLAREILTAAAYDMQKDPDITLTRAVFGIIGGDIDNGALPELGEAYSNANAALTMRLNVASRY